MEGARGNSKVMQADAEGGKVHGLYFAVEEGLSLTKGPAYGLRDSRTHPNEIIKALVKRRTN